MFFLYHARSRPTGEVLAAALGSEHGERANFQTTYPIVRWGNRAFPALDIGRSVLNTAEAIGRASDKLGALGAMRDAGIPVPDWDENPEALIERVGYPILGRRRSHARGTDITLCLQRRDYQRRQRDYYIAYIPTAREYRLHVVGNRVIRVQGKFLDVSEQYKPWIRNYASGYRFRAPRRRLHNARLESAVQAVQALGLDFGAVDLIVADNGSHYILEVNTSPACSPITGAAYVTAIAGLLDMDTERLNFGALDVLNPETEEQDSEDEAENPENEEGEDA